MPRDSKTTKKRKAPRLSYGAYQIAKVLDDQQRASKKQAAIETAAAGMVGAGANATALLNTRIANRNAMGLSGSGAYNFSHLGTDIRDFGRKSGINLGNVMKAATFAKGLMGGGLYGGQGNYTDNQLIEGGKPSMSVTGANDETDTIIVSDCEYVKDIFAPTIASGSSAFASQRIEVNAGLPSFAPNLSQLACNYTEYEIHQLVYELRPVISESNVNNGQTGSAMMVFNYNPNDDPFDDKESVMQAHGSISGRIIEPLRMGVECDPMKTKQTEFFIRTGPVPYGKDADEYDVGAITIATNNIPSAFSNTQLFELYVYYTVQLRKRKAGALRLNNQLRDQYFCTHNEAYADLFKPSIDFVTGSGGVIYSQQNNLHTSIAGTSAGRVLNITFPADYNGFVEVILTVEGTVLTAGTDGVTSTVAGTVTKVSDLVPGLGLAGDVIRSEEFNIATYGLNYRGHFKVKSAVGGVDNKITITIDNAATTRTGWSLDIRELTVSHWTSRTNGKPVVLNYQDNAQVSI